VPVRPCQKPADHLVVVTPPPRDVRRERLGELRGCTASRVFPDPTGANRESLAHSAATALEQRLHVALDVTLPGPDRDPAVHQRAERELVDEAA
jgi:hypothetical protein